MKIRTQKIETEYFITKLPDFEQFKNKFKKITNNIPKKNIQTEYFKLSHTDYNVPYDYKSYKSITQKYLTSYLQEIANKLNCKYYAVHDIWYQQYSDGDYHNWHNHVGCMYSNILYVDLNSKSFATELFDAANNQVIQVDVSEGDILCFPANIIHRSPIIDTSSKSVLSFNTSFFDVDKQRIIN